MRLKLEPVGVAVAEGHVDFAVAPITAEHEPFRQTSGSLGDGETFPVKGWRQGNGQLAEDRVSVAVGSYVQLAQAELIAARRLHCAAQGRGHYLRPQADAQHGFAQGHCLAQVCALMVNGGVVVVGRHWAAECHNEVNLLQQWRRKAVEGGRRLKDV